jgi:Domain of unknown function (DUF4333)
MASRFRYGIGSLSLIAVLLFAGCAGTVVDREKLQDTVEVSLERSVHEKIKEVDCPSDLPVDPGSTFTCEVTFSSGKRETATLKIRNEDADISMIGIEATK